MWVLGVPDGPARMGLPAKAPTMGLHIWNLRGARDALFREVHYDHRQRPRHANGQHYRRLILARCDRHTTRSSTPQPATMSSSSVFAEVVARLQKVHTESFGTATVGPEHAQPPVGLQSAAVLVGLFEQDGEVRVLLTQRSSKLRSHAGEVALPVRCSWAGPWTSAVARVPTHTVWLLTCARREESTMPQMGTFSTPPSVKRMRKLGFRTMRRSQLQS